jgi:hypothetical protein
VSTIVSVHHRHAIAIPSEDEFPGRLQTFDEIAEFFVEHTAFDTFVPRTFVIVGIGADAPVQDAVVRVRLRLARGEI